MPLLHVNLIITEFIS